MTNTTTRRTLAERLAELTGLHYSEAHRAVSSLLESLTTDLAEGRRIELREFGIFSTKVRAACQRHNPKTLEKVQLPAVRKVRFKPGKAMRERVRGE